MTTQTLSESRESQYASEAAKDAPGAETMAHAQQARPCGPPAVTASAANEPSPIDPNTEINSIATTVETSESKPSEGVQDSNQKKATLAMSAQSTRHGRDKASPYRPLSSTAHSIRLVRIHESDEVDDPIVCELFETPFAEQCKFEALSYMWGEEKSDEGITVNGVHLEVGKNLRDALRYLRRRPRKTYWIDAICINQDDISERNKQVGMMRHIYERAQCVLTWLGNKYALYEDRLAELKGLGYFRAPETQIGSEKPDVASRTQAERNMAQELYNDDYWSRLWIIQEIGLAKQVEVCFGNSSVSWDGFIHFQTMHNLGDAGPFVLKHQRTHRFTGGNTLLKLLEAHKDAQCKDPKDKVYGLVGLALDARGFTIDYSRSRYQVWSYFMEFCNNRGIFGKMSVIQAASLARYALMGERSHPLSNILRAYHAGDVTDDTMPNQNAFELPAKVIGCVKLVGPRPEDMVADMDVVEMWDHSVQQNHPDDIDWAHFESEKLKRIIYEFDLNSLDRKCSNFKSTVSWEGWIAEYYPRYIEQVTRDATPLLSKDSRGDGSSKTTYRLYQLLENRHNIDLKMGIATGEIRVGDLICWTPGSWRALVVRCQLLREATIATKSVWKSHVVGTATVTNDLEGCLAEKHNQRVAERDFPEMAVHVDARTVFTLIDDGGSTVQYR